MMSLRLEKVFIAKATTNDPGCKFDKMSALYSWQQRKREMKKKKKQKFRRRTMRGF